MATNCIKLGVGSPAYGRTVASRHNRMWREFGHALALSPERFFLLYDNDVDVCGVDVARNTLIEESISVGCDWMLMVDADSWVHEGRDLLSMISQADRAGAAVVAAPVRRRDAGNDHPMIYRLVDAPVRMQFDMFGAAGRPMPQPVPVPEAQFQGAVIEVDAAATAIMAINLGFLRNQRALGLIGLPWFKFTYTPQTCSIAASEDLDFCRRVRDAGGTVLCDGRVSTGHRGRAPDHVYRASKGFDL